MVDFPLARTAKGPDVVALQHLLNRAGGMVAVDGDFGPATEGAVTWVQRDIGLPPTGQADAVLWSALETLPEPSTELPSEAIAFIAREEVGGRAYFESHVSKPHYPGGSSGVTIGIGYDLRFQNAAGFERDWGGELSGDTMAALRPWLGEAGSAGAVRDLSSIRIPFPAAWRVFVTHVLPRFIGTARDAFAGYDDLPPLCRGVLVSLVYNRGSSMKGDSRREMREIRDRIAERNWTAVPEAILSMRRLWPEASGLYGRRTREAGLWRAGLGA